MKRDILAFILLIFVLLGYVAIGESYWREASVSIMMFLTIPQIIYYKRRKMK